MNFYEFLKRELGELRDFSTQHSVLKPCSISLELNCFLYLRVNQQLFISFIEEQRAVREGFRQYFYISLPLRVLAVPFLFHDKSGKIAGFNPFHIAFL